VKSLWSAAARRRFSVSVKLLHTPFFLVAQRKSIDCRHYPSEKNCSLKISGREEEELDAAVQHAASGARAQEHAGLARADSLDAYRLSRLATRTTLIEAVCRGSTSTFFGFAPVASLLRRRVLQVVGVRCREVCRTTRHRRPQAGSPITEVRAVALVV